ncbi:MAG: DUF4298 domain-containing protein [Bacteroidales bacterium]|nr:DUF4298 domain-containing protein [Bacteroidales bacterium]
MVWTLDSRSINVFKIKDKHVNMDTRQMARIKKMEDDFRLVREVIDTLDGALYDYEAVRRKITRLTEYQTSGRWLKDFEADERGELHGTLERGVLSEDGLDNLLDDIASVHAKMQQVVFARSCRLSF